MDTTRLLTLLTGVGLAASLSGCGSDDGAAAPDGPTTLQPADATATAAAGLTRVTCALGERTVSLDLPADLAGRPNDDVDPQAKDVCSYAIPPDGFDGLAVTVSLDPKGLDDELAAAREGEDTGGDEATEDIEMVEGRAVFGETVGDHLSYFDFYDGDSRYQHYGHADGVTLHVEGGKDLGENEIEQTFEEIAGTLRSAAG